jgi:hypothetical protein
VSFFWRSRHARACSQRPELRFSQINNTKFRILVYGLYVFIIRRVVDLTFQNNFFKPNTRTAIQGYRYSGTFFWYNVHVPTCAVVTSPCNLCTKTHPHPAAPTAPRNNEELGPGIRPKFQIHQDYSLYCMRRASCFERRSQRNLKVDFVRLRASDRSGYSLSSINHTKFSTQGHKNFSFCEQTLHSGTPCPAQRVLQSATIHASN